jgi:hypothetical protein
VLDEQKSTRWSEQHVADNYCFHYRRVSSFLMCVVSTTQYFKALALLDSLHSMFANEFPELLNAHHALDLVLF